MGVSKILSLLFLLGGFGYYMVFYKLNIVILVFFLVLINFIFISGFFTGGTASGGLRPQSAICTAETTSPQTCRGTYPSSCPSAGGNDLLSCSDGNSESHLTRRNEAASVEATYYNSSISPGCEEIKSVELCYNWNSDSNDPTSCDIAFHNGDNSWITKVSSCPGTTGASACINITSDVSWGCDNFFNETANNSVIRARQTSPQQGRTAAANFDALYFLVDYVPDEHYISGIVNDSLDGTDANDLEVVLWNPINGQSDNLTDIIGVNGNSGIDNNYEIDCKMLNSPCSVGDVLNIKVLSYPFSEIVNVTVTSAFYDFVSDIRLNSAPNISEVFVDDSYQSPIFPGNEIDLLANSTQEVFCEAVIDELDGDSLQNIKAEFFDTGISFFGDSDDFNYHYSNNSCFLNQSYGNENQSKVNCKFDVLYNANSGSWNCTVSVEDNFSVSGNSSDNSNINQLLSIGIQDFFNLGRISVNNVSREAILNITNFGNVKINLSLSGYGDSEGDGYAMVCSSGEIPIYYKKYNLTSSTPGRLSLNQFEENYINLTSSSLVRRFNLNYRQDELINEAVKPAYWRIYVPQDILGACSGNIVISATTENEI
ncbi:hypothetical protein K9L16_01395 [Candidatus Pacearchaeota archaeon]|nr:hypothetical protein [Candidatus Pacearchaeota archaeon]